MSASGAKLELSVANDYILKYSDLQFIKEIGSGAAGAVWFGRHIPTNREVAIKKLHDTEMNQQQKALFFREVACLAAAQHQFLLQFIGFTDTKPFCLVTKYIKNGSLFSIIHDDKNVMLTPTDMTVIAFGISCGMQYIHGLNMIHRDLKPQNILIDDRKMPVICDFGSSRKIDASMTGLCGTPNYMAPEFIRNENYDQSVDVYSFGMVLWEMLARETPFYGMEPPQVICAIIVGQALEIPEDAPAPLADLIQRCWSTNPADRPSFAQITKALAAGEVVFPGCNMKSYHERIMPFTTAMKRNSGGSRSNQFASMQITLKPGQKPGNSLPELSHDARPVMKEMRVIQLANSYVTSFTSGTEQQIKLSLDFFLAHIDDKEIIRVEIWSKFLPLLASPPEGLAEKARQLSVKFAQNYEILSSIRQVPDLHQFLCPNSFDLFLYVICFLPVKIDKKLVERLFSYAAEEKAIILLCKIMAMVDVASDMAFSIIDFFYEHIYEMADRRGGHLALRTLSAEGRMNKEMLRAFAKSTITANMVATYECVFSFEPITDLFTLDQILTHVTADDERLRSCALEYLRRHARNAEGEPLRRVMDALLQSVLRYTPDPAVLLLCRIAQDPVKSWEFLKTETAEIWLKVAPEKVPVMMRLFVCVFSHDRLLPFVPTLPSTVDFMAAAMRNGDNQCFLSACFVLKKAKFDEGYARRLDESGIIEMMIAKLKEKLSDLQTVGLISRVLRMVARVFYSPSFPEIIPILVQALNDEAPAMKECIKTVTVMCRHKRIVDLLLDANVIGMISRMTLPDDVSSCARDMYKNLKAVGLNLP